MVESEEILSVWDTLPSASSSVVSSVYFKVWNLVRRIEEGEFSNAIDGQVNKDISFGIVGMWKEVSRLLDEAGTYHDAVETAYCER